MHNLNSDEKRECVPVFIVKFCARGTYVHKRAVENTILEIAKSFPAIVLYGPRQVGKSTTLDCIFPENFNRVTLDDLEDINLAQQNPRLFLETLQWPVIIGEIKIKIDVQRKIWLRNNEERKLIAATNETLFRNFISIVALRTAQELHYDEIANAVGIDVKTCKRWLCILEPPGIIYLLQPYMANVSNRIIKAPKLYFMDTGLCAFLCKRPNAQMLENCAMSGVFLKHIL